MTCQDSLKGGDQSKDLDFGGRIILKLIFGK
jgi:hypothetical protein